MAQTVKRLPTMWETWVQSLGRENLLEKEVATHSSILAWKIPWMEEPGRPQSMGLQRVGHDWATSPNKKVGLTKFLKILLSMEKKWKSPYSPWNSPGQNTGVGSLSLLQGIFPTQGSNPGLPHCRQILYPVEPQGSLRILEWVAYPFSSGSSWPRNRTGVSCIAGGFFTNWAIREAPYKYRTIS